MGRKKVIVCFRLSRKTIEQLRSIRDYLVRKKKVQDWEEVFNILIEKFWSSEYKTI